MSKTQKTQKTQCCIKIHAPLTFKMVNQQGLSLFVEATKFQAISSQALPFVY